MKRRPCEGVGNILAFNWPMYLGALLTLPLCYLAHQVMPSPLWNLAGAAALYLTLASLAVSWYVYDHAGLYRWEFLPAAPAGSIANIHAGFDESSASLQLRYPGAELTILDFYDPVRHTEASIRRARARCRPLPGTLSCTSTALPLADASQDLIFNLFAAHEIRDHQERVQFFREVRRALRGRAVVVEHTRDLANLLAFGPGFGHFHSPAEWRRCWREAGLSLVQESFFTPWVRVFVLERA